MSHAAKRSPFRSAIDKMQGYAPGEWPALDAGVLKLNSNENAYPPSPKVLAALSGFDGELLRRYPDPRSQDFCQVVSQTLGIPSRLGNCRKWQRRCANTASASLRRARANNCLSYSDLRAIQNVGRHAARRNPRDSLRY